uniref:Probable glycine cleavage system H protein n=1 Tax=Fervidicoccus fontis TaxID=683846 RepID=A0A7C1E8J2_9CREN
MDKYLEESGYKVATDRLYTREDEWVKVESGKATIGITDYAQKQLKDIVGVDLPVLGRTYRKGEAIAFVDSIKASAEVYAPLSGKVIEINESLQDDPQLINKDPYGDGWIARIEVLNIDETKDLMKPEEYVEYIRRRAR